MGFVRKESENNEYYFVLKALNGKVVLTSETYKTKSGMENGISSVKENVSREGAFKKFVGEDGQFYFNLRSKNNKVIGSSEGYKTNWGRSIGMLSVRISAKI